MSEPLEFQGYYFEVVIYFDDNIEEPLTNTLFIECGNLSHEQIKSSIKKRGMVYDEAPILARIHVYDVFGEDWEVMEHNRVIELNDKQCKHIWLWY
jgi:hypothetical protein